MDTRITPFGDHPDGGKITELKENEPIPEHMMPISFEAQKILDEIPQDQRVQFVLDSTDEKLKKEKEWLINKLQKQHQEDFINLQRKLGKL